MSLNTYRKVTLDGCLFINKHGCSQDLKVPFERLDSQFYVLGNTKGFRFTSQSELINHLKTLALQHGVAYESLTSKELDFLKRDFPSRVSEYGKGGDLFVRPVLDRRNPDLVAYES
jgi:hypothetical protein